MLESNNDDADIEACHNEPGQYHTHRQILAGMFHFLCNAGNLRQTTEAYKNQTGCGKYFQPAMVQKALESHGFYAFTAKEYEEAQYRKQYHHENNLKPACMFNTYDIQYGKKQAAAGRYGFQMP